MYSKLKFLPFLLIALSAIIGFSCSSKDDNDPVVVDTSIIVEISDVNQKIEDLDNLTLSALEDLGLSSRKSNIAYGDYCSSVVIIKDQEIKTISIDFGNGCVSPNGVNRKGKILIKYSGALLVPGANIETTFEGYEVNGYKIEGTRTITNTKLDIFANSITLAVKIENGKVTFPDGGFVTINTTEERIVTLTSTGYEGSITGTASGNSKDGKAFTSTIIDPLEITQSCIESGVYNPTSGQIEFTYIGIKMTLDYGTGACDKDATITYPGGVKNITFD
ncbi:hypothetical protein [Algoriphagus sp.]|uniref:hypothetical protein n=1 Tax=Algoriphagus sp. TaxID=1872435 RepID=UPI0025F4CA57|nr:hypothetical protein [Algoriphagus sp.]